jgi:LysM repeat protein
MSDKSAQEIIESYNRRQARAPRAFLIGAIALLLIFAGGVLLVRWYRNPDVPLFPPNTTDTPTATVTQSLTPVPPTTTPLPPSDTPEPTESPTITPTPTIDGAFFYTVNEGDTLFSIAEAFGVDINRLLQVNELTTDDPIFVGQQILVPDPNEELPTATPLPEGLPPGFEIEYVIQTGDTLTGIALQFNSTEEAILEANEALEDPNSIFVGQLIIVPINLVTPVPTGTEAPALTTPGAIITLTPTTEGGDATATP